MSPTSITAIRPEIMSLHADDRVSKAIEKLGGNSAERVGEIYRLLREVEAAELGFWAANCVLPLIPVALVASEYYFHGKQVFGISILTAIVHGVGLAVCSLWLYIAAALAMRKYVFKAAERRIFAALGPLISDEEGTRVADAIGEIEPEQGTYLWAARRQSRAS